MKALRKWQSALMGLGLLGMSNVAFAEDVLDTGDTAWILVIPLGCWYRQRWC